MASSVAAYSDRHATLNNSPLSVRDLAKSYDGRAAVDGISFELKRGECFGLLGPNGAGKTTTFRMCLGLSTADSGSISVFGLPMPEETLAFPSLK